MLDIEKLADINAVAQGGYIGGIDQGLSRGSSHILERRFLRYVSEVSTPLFSIWGLHWTAHNCLIFPYFSSVFVFPQNVEKHAHMQVL